MSTALAIMPEDGSAGAPLEVSRELQDEVARDIELATAMPLHQPAPAGKGSPPKHLENPFVTPAFLDPGGGARGEAVTAGTTMEPGSIREFTFRATLAIALLSALCFFLGIGSAAAPWFSLALFPSEPSCLVVYGLTAYGRSASGCPEAVAAQLVPFPTAYNDKAGAKVLEAVGTLGFAAFLMVSALLCSGGAAVVAGLMSWRLGRGLPPARIGNAFLLVALSASAFTLAVVSMIAGSTRLLLALRQAQADSPSPATPVVQGGHGAGDCMVVFLTGVMLASVVVKIRVRAAAVMAEGGSERGELEALLGTEPEGHFCL